MTETILFDQAAIEQRTRELGREIRKDFSVYKRLHFIVVMHGGLPFFRLLYPAVTDWVYSKSQMRRVRGFRPEVETHFVQASSYAAGKRTDEVLLDWQKDEPPDLRLREAALIVDDIADTGSTIAQVREAVREQSLIYSDEVYAVTLLQRHSCRHLPRYAGFVVDNDDFLYGFGLDDTDGSAREKPYVAMRRD